MGNAGSILSGPTAFGNCLTSNLPSQLVALPSKIDYLLSDVKIYNLAVPVKPVAVIYPTTSSHVVAAIKCASQYQVKVQAKSGGHSYANFGKHDWQL
jgi:hypothetical protein